MPKNGLMVIALEQDPEFNLDELCRVCRVTPQFIQDLVEYGAIEPQGYSFENWRFDGSHLRRVRIVVHLQNDLEVNLAGAVLILDMLDEMEIMRARLNVLEKYFESSQGIF